MALRLGLERITEALDRLGNPHHSFQALHVAGTNGKGSTCALLECALLACLAPSGLRIGKFVSPYLAEPRDAVSIDGEVLPPSAWAGALGEVDGCAPPGLTPFERWTAAAFVAFARGGVGLAVVEVGVGGGGDATNVLPPPLLALVTPIAMDHVDLLGPGLVDIAGHKAGIFKAGGGGAVTAPGQAPEVLAVLQARAQAAGLALVVAPPLAWERRGVLRAPAPEGAAGSSAPGGQSPPPVLLPMGLPGEFQAVNAALAWAALQALGAERWPALRCAATVGQAWRGAQWRGRAELVLLRLPPLPPPALQPEQQAQSPDAPPPPLTLQCTLDGGHNAHAIRQSNVVLALAFGFAACSLFFVEDTVALL